MSDELRELYQEMILDHGKRPRNFGKPEHADCTAEGANPLCGDHCSVYLDVENGRLSGVRFDGQGCAISTASASLMTEAVKGLTLEETRELFERLHDLVTKDEARTDTRLGKLAVFAGVRQFPLRVKCATLAWHTLLAAIEGKNEPVSSEDQA
jgi:nitrogen fixation protein NifU and related proteins